MSDTWLDPSADINDQLLPGEVFWRERQRYLEFRGYILRPRYHPDWVPSWKVNPRLHRMDCEDYWNITYDQIIDARRSSDNKLVCIKRVKSGSEEIRISTYFSRPPQRDDPRNHCIPVLDTFEDQENPGIAYLVMPFLRPMNNPPFQLVEDALVFADQVLEGLAFMHEHYVAHRDCAPTNILMDGDSMYPEGYHPVFQDSLPDFHSVARPYSRAGAPSPVKYYFADFGLSMLIPPDSSRTARGIVGADRDVPELSVEIPYDPFKVDIYILGNVFRNEIFKKYLRVDFLRPLMRSMMRTNPQSRPNADEVLRQWKQIRAQISVLHAACRLRGRDEGIVTTVVLDVISLFKVSFILARRLLRWTAEWLMLICG